MVFPFSAADRRRRMDAIGEAFEQSVTYLCYSLISDAADPHTRSVSNRWCALWEVNCGPLLRFAGPAVIYPARQRDSNVVRWMRPRLHVAQREVFLAAWAEIGWYPADSLGCPSAAHCAVFFRRPCPSADRLCVPKSSSACAF